jgi:hypothetical protein
VHEHCKYTSAIDKYWYFTTEAAANAFFITMREQWGAKGDTDTYFTCTDDDDYVELTAA